MHLNPQSQQFANSKKNFAAMSGTTLAGVILLHGLAGWCLVTIQIPKLQPLKLPEPIEVTLAMPQPKPVFKPLLESKSELKPEPKSKPTPKPKPEPTPKPKPEPKLKPEPQIQPQQKIVPVPEVSVVTSSEVTLQPASPSPLVDNPTSTIIDSPSVSQVPSSSPMPVSIPVSQASWIRQPNINAKKNKRELRNILHIKEATVKSILIKFKLHINAKGEIIKIDVLKSSGSTRLDNEFVRQVKRARMQPYKENGIPKPVVMNLPLMLPVR